MKSFCKFKNMQKDNKRVVLFTILFSMVLVFGCGMFYAYAYYNKNATISFLSSTIGDFDTGNGDINIMIYVEDDNGKYNLIKNIPSFGYYLNDYLTNCSAIYKVNNKIAVTSNEKVTCKFYYSKLQDADIKIMTMIEDQNGIYEYNNKLYKLSDYIPAYGYEYKDYKCMNNEINANLTYHAEIRKFSLDTKATNLCYAYFDNIGITDVNVNVYVREDLATNKYKLVESIPSLRTFVLSTTTNSYCKNKDGTTSSDVVKYINGQIQITAREPEECNVYLDVVS